MRMESPLPLGERELPVGDELKGTVRRHQRVVMLRQRHGQAMRRHQTAVQGKAGLDLSTDRDEAPADRALWEQSVRAGNDAR